MKRTILCPCGAALLIAMVIQATTWGAAASGPRVTTLVLQPSRFDTGQRYTLLPKAEELTEGDAVPLYDKAVENLPKNMDNNQIREWTSAPLGELPLDQVQTFLRQAQPALDSIAKAAKCKSHNWPPFEPGVAVSHLSEYRQLTFILCLKARSEIARKQYDEAVATLQSGMTMAKHVGEAPTLIQSLVGIAMVGMMLRTTDDFRQAPDSPNLYAALKALPQPLVDVEEAIATEARALDTSTEYTGAVREAMRKQTEPAYERTRQIARRLVADMGVNQCVEALRHHAATHEGKLPAQLSDITGVKLPDDPVTQEPFKYRLDGTRAVLETTAPEGGSPREAKRYEITVAH